MLKSRLKSAFTIKDFLILAIVFMLFFVFTPSVVENVSANVQTSRDTTYLTKCLQDIKNNFLTRGIEDTNSKNCDLVTCFGIDLGKSLRDGKITIFKKEDAETYCYDAGGAFDTAEEQNIIPPGENSKTIKFNSRKATSWN